ncbi:MAG: UDP-N-acetylmuramoyl-tripeptide--D-alanyl-D-alanine ligase [Pseudomonadota bacterium]
MMTLSEARRIVNGRIMGQDVAFSGVSIDTRTLQSGDLYVAISGKRFDGHDFVAQAQEAGAVAAIVGREVDSVLPCLIVEDTLSALGVLGAEWRQRLGVSLIGVTGSNGKTTVKEIVAAVLKVNAPVLFTRGNLNNDIGVPLTLLRLRPKHRYAVIEMGANHAGEIAYTSGLAKPDVSVVTNAGSAHIEGFGSLEGVARSKGELVESLRSDGIAVLNADDRFFRFWEQLAGNRRIISFGLAPEASVRATALNFETSPGGFKTCFDLVYEGRAHKMTLVLAGRHNVCNALAAAAACIAIGIDMSQVAQGLASARPVAGRMEPLIGAHGGVIVNDTYNANPSSLQAALDVLIQLGGEPWLALGAFMELGADSAEFHENMGKEAKRLGVVRLYAIGPNTERAVQAFGEGAAFFSHQGDLIKALSRDIHRDVALLVKGSRSQHMEAVVEALAAAGEQ